ncbi:MAG TPA: DoxX family protein [Candidatus Acidoferrum sp.]|nr:DoxX family protein [Candidatus Acidoferrum sp.]
MNTRLKNISLPLLRWTLGLVVILQSGRFMFSASAAHILAKAGLPAWVRPALGGAELLAAILFLVPFTTLVGGYLLLVIFALAAVVHLLHGQFGVEGLVLYASVVLACMTTRELKIPEAPDDRG